MSGRFGFRSREGILSRELAVVVVLKVALLLLLWLVFFNGESVPTSSGVAAALLKSTIPVQTGDGQ